MGRPRPPEVGSFVEHGLYTAWCRIEDRDSDDARIVYDFKNIAGVTKRSFRVRHVYQETREQTEARVALLWEDALDALCIYPATSLGGLSMAEARHARRYTGVKTFAFRSADCEIRSWAVVTNWRVVLELVHPRAGRFMVELDRSDNIVTHWQPDEPCGLCGELEIGRAHV